MILWLVVYVLTLVLHVSLSIHATYASAWLFVVPHVLVLLSLLMLERRRHGTVVTPTGMFVAVYAVVIVVPIAINDLAVSSLWLDFTRLSKGSEIHLVFLIVCALVYQLFHRCSGVPSSVENIPGVEWIRQYYWFVLGSSVFFTVVGLASLVALGGLNLVEFIANPISMFEARWSGGNWASLISGAFFSLFVVILVLRMGRDLSKAGLVGGAVFVLLQTISSGSKGGFFFPLSSLLMVHGFVKRRLGRFSLALIALVLAILVPLSFGWRGAFAPGSSILETLVDYNHVFYYSSRAFVEIRPDVRYFEQALVDLAITLIPRALWGDKPIEYGLTRRVLDYEFRGTTWSLPVVRSFVTMGLAEVWVALGIPGIVLSGAILGFLLSAAARNLERPTSLGRFAYAVFLVGSIYPIMRGAFLNTYIYNMIITYLVALAVDRVARHLYLHGQQKPRMGYTYSSVEDGLQSKGSEHSLSHTW